VRFSSYWRHILTLSLIATLLPACSLSPNVRKQKYFENGQMHFEKGEYHEAEIKFAEAIKIDSGYADAHFQLAECYLHLQQPDRAYQEFARTVELQPEHYTARIAMANLLIQHRDFPLAQEQADVLLQRRINDPAVHAMASSLLAAQDKIPGAIAEMQKTVALDPGRWEPYLSLALLRLRSNELYAAEENLKKVIALNPKAMQAHLVLGTYYQSHNRMSEAEQQFRSAIALDPSTLDPREALARLYLSEGKRTEAEEILKQALQDLSHNPNSFFALSTFYFMTGDMDKAVAQYRALYQERPKDFEIKKKYIQLLIQTKHYDEARSLDNEILNTTPSDDDALLYQSQLQITNGDVSDAARTLQTVVRDAPNNIQAHYALGVALQKQGNLESAKSEWRAASRLDPNFLDAQRSIADLAMLQGDMNTLEDASNQMIRLQPDSPEGYALRGLAYINRKHYREAEQSIRKAIAIAPQSSFGYVQLGNLRFAQKQYNDAAKAYRDALNRNANSTDALRGLLSTCLAEKQIDNAIAIAKAQISKSPANSSFYNLLGAVLFHYKNDLVAAEAAFQKSVALEKHNSDAIIQLCHVRAAKGDIDQAIATGQQALYDTPREPALYTLMGNLYESKQDWQKAEDAYQNALAFNSQNPVNSNNLARVMLRIGGNLDIALSLAQTARRGLPNSPDVADTLGWIYYYKGVYPLALSYLQEALTLQEKARLPDNPDIHYHLGMTYEKTEQTTLARRQFEHLLQVYPNYRNAADIRKELRSMKT
jgi:tetratricopeptide (TPR) repeat protein